jgi:hypothetical protein
MSVCFNIALSLVSRGLASRLSPSTESYYMSKIFVASEVNSAVKLLRIMP